MELQALSEELCRKYFLFIHEKVRESDRRRKEQEKGENSGGLDARVYFSVFDQEKDWDNIPAQIQQLSAYYIPYYKTKQPDSLDFASEELALRDAIEIFQYVYEDKCLADYKIVNLAADKYASAGMAGMSEYIDEIGWGAIKNNLLSIELESGAFTTISVSPDQIATIHKFYSKMDDKDMLSECSDAVLGAYIAKDYTQLSIDDVSWRMPKLLEVYRPYFEQLMYNYFDFWTVLISPLTAKDRWEKRLRKFMPKLMNKLEELESRRRRRSFKPIDENAELPF